MVIGILYFCSECPGTTSLSSKCQCESMSLWRWHTVTIYAIFSWCFGTRTLRKSIHHENKKTVQLFEVFFFLQKILSSFLVLYLSLLVSYSLSVLYCFQNFFIFYIFYFFQVCIFSIILSLIKPHTLVMWIWRIQKAEMDNYLLKKELKT